MEVGRCLDDGLYYTALTISFALPNFINDAVGGLAGFVINDIIAVSGSSTIVAGVLVNNDAVYTVTNSVAGSLTVTPAVIAAPVGASVTISRPAVAVDESGLSLIHI